MAAASVFADNSEVSHQPRDHLLGAAGPGEAAVVGGLARPGGLLPSRRLLDRPPRL